MSQKYFYINYPSMNGIVLVGADKVQELVEKFKMTFLVPVFSTGEDAEIFMDFMGLPGASILELTTSTREEVNLFN